MANFRSRRLGLCDRELVRAVVLVVGMLCGCGRHGFDLLIDGAAADTSPRSVTVQNGAATLTGLTTDVSIDAVDPTKAFLMFGASNDGMPPDGDADAFQLAGQLVGPTTLSFERAVDPGSPATIEWYVVELHTGASVQRGRSNLQNLTVLDAVLSTVAEDRAFPILSFRTAGGTYDGGDYLRARITSPTNLEISRSEAEDQLSNVEWQVVELDQATVQSGVIDMAAAATSTNATISMIDPTRLLLLFTYSRGATNTGLMALRGRVVDATTLAFDRDVANGDPLSIAWYAIELPEGTRVQRATTSFASAQTTATAVISPVDLTRSMALGGAAYYRGGKSPSLVDIRGLDSFTFDLTSPTSLTLERFVGGATADVEWQVIELPQ
jgi:hypothetical protein